MSVEPYYIISSIGENQVIRLIYAACCAVTEVVSLEDKVTGEKIINSNNIKEYKK